MLKGDGFSYTATTAGSAFDAVLAVYFSFNGCEQLYCYDNTTSKLSWPSRSDLDYYILVAGFPGETGGYTLTLTVRIVSSIFDLC